MASHASNHAIGVFYVSLNGLKKKETAHSLVMMMMMMMIMQCSMYGVMAAVMF